MALDSNGFLPPGRANWDECTAAERFSATWQMSKAHYIAKGLHVEGQPMDKTVVRKFSTREEWIKAEEEKAKDL